MSKPDDDRRVRFAHEYVKDLNATQAAIRAGYSARTAKAQGSRLLTKVDVQAVIQGLVAKVATKAEITVERTLQEIARIAYSDARKLYRADGSLKAIHELDDDAAACVAGIETEEEYHDGVPEANVAPSVTITRKVKRWDKVKALDKCMAYLGLHKTQNPAEGGGLALTINLSGGKRVR